MQVDLSEDQVRALTMLQGAIKYSDSFKEISTDQPTDDSDVTIEDESCCVFELIVEETGDRLKYGVLREIASIKLDA